MLLNLFPEYKFVRVRKSGLIVLKKTWWSLRRTVVSITDLMVGEIPKRIADKAKRDGKGTEYLKLFNTHISTIIHISAYSDSFCVVDYVWDRYTELCIEVPLISFEINEYELNEKSRNFIPLGFFENTYWFGIIKSLKQTRLSYRGSPIIDKINKIKNKYL